MPAATPESQPFGYRSEQPYPGQGQRHWAAWTTASGPVAKTRDHHRRQGPAQWNGPEGRPARQCSPSRPATAQVALGDVMRSWGRRDSQRDGQAGAPDLAGVNVTVSVRTYPASRASGFHNRHVPQVGSVIRCPIDTGQEIVESDRRPGRVAPTQFALSNSFGFGGDNAVLALRRWPAEA